MLVGRPPLVLPLRYMTHEVERTLYDACDDVSMADLLLMLYEWDIHTTH